MQRLELQLWYGELLVADLHEVSPDQGTWFSTYELRISSNEGHLQKQLFDYVAFCEEFNDRIGRGEDHDFAEFDRFGPIAHAGSWRIPLPGDELMPMEGRLYFAWGMASWHHPETESDREAAAFDLWERIAERASMSD